jgi:hypothetical protein
VSKKPESQEQELADIMNALAESVAAASDEEILQEARARGEDPAEAARATKDLLLNAAQTYRQRRLHEAQREYENHIAIMQTRTYELPVSVAERRQLLNLIVSRQSALRAALTAQYRDFTSIADTDVESCLKQLQELGFLDEVSTPEASKK